MDHAQMEKRDHIIEAARDVFRRYGYNKTSIADIAQEARMGKGTIYYYFDSKEDIFVQILRSQAEMLYTHMENLLTEGGDTRKMLQRFMVEPVHMIVENAPLLMGVLQESYDTFLNKIMAFKQQYHDTILDTFRRLFERGQQEGVVRNDLDASKTTTLVHRWLHSWMCSMHDEHGGIKFDAESLDIFMQDYKQIVDIVMHGILIKEEQ